MSDKDLYDLLYEEHGYDLSPKQHGVVFGLAYQYGHSAGEHEIAEYYREFASAARELIFADDVR